MPFVNKGFHAKRPADGAHKLPPGQYETRDFPVLTAGPTPRINLANWEFRLEGLVETPVRWSWNEFNALPQQDFNPDIHCVTKWSKFDTKWRGVSLDTLLEHVQLKPEAAFALAFSYGGYTTNLPLADLRNAQAFIGLQYEGKLLTPEHGGPARLVVPHLYFWKSAKWVQGLRLLGVDKPGFWEEAGYSMHGDPWKEQRYGSDDDEADPSSSRP
ncbi:sulfite oxidase-like oxidoreductase [Hymenobacter caeli]|uniref:DMSO/TMAO reductase YedYZ molybdopterin-dependent catalytic subunit n=1 Tax=Hymenobacter caeli TaxID=2735894 RepID=A0ABX2FRV9_9BACT|nr:sulfite oxidase-like oxidoreductase [Hymenobacter caeli]NRT19918.1 DMSO/TMAO reductase YedYZ molybdopterin-dependent catalytic subunit [Hymenobacter caeli]